MYIFRAIIFVIAIFRVHEAASSEPDRYAMHLEEQGTKFDQEVDVDEENEVEIFKVPHHNNVDGADFMNDFKLRLSAIRVPVQKACYISDLVPDMPDPTKMKADLERGSHLKTGKLPVQKIYQDWMVQGDVDRLALPQSFREFCGRLPMYRAVLITRNSTAAPFKVRQKRDPTMVKWLRFCDLSKQQAFQDKCMDAPSWDVNCHFNGIRCVRVFKCTNTPPVKEWNCFITHIYHQHAMCCEYACTI